VKRAVPAWSGISEKNTACDHLPPFHQAISPARRKGGARADGMTGVMKTCLNGNHLFFAMADMLACFIGLIKPVINTPMV
jgi:hypothetical protein